MRYRTLGRTGLQVSEAMMGTTTFGRQIWEDEGLPIIEAALDAGVNFFDTSDVYGEGEAERILGKALKGRRGSAVIATKVWGRTGPHPNDEGLSRKHVMDAVESSLRRLQTDYIDLYQFHQWDDGTPLEESLRAVDDLVRQGKVRYVGCSNFAAWQLAKGLWLSEVHNLARIDCVQPRYSLVSREIEAELLPLCRTEGVGVIAYNPLAGGLLTGKYDRTKPPPPDTRLGVRPLYKEMFWSDRNFDAIERLQALGEKLGRSIVGLALGWLLARSGVTCAILGATKADQVRANLAAMEVPLTAEEVTLVEQAVSG